MAADFKSKHAGSHLVLSDVERRSFRAAGMRRSFWSLLHWRFLQNVWRAWRKGHRQTKVLGDPWQQGGVLVFAATGQLRHQQLDRAGGDEIDLDAVLAAVRTG